jgi:glycosyltransferase involved in cell wall biosynthesis
MKICVVSPRYTFTGVALAQIRLARALAEQGHVVDMVFGCLDRTHLPVGTAELPEIPGVSMVNWNEEKVRGMFLPMCRYLRVEKPDVVFSAEDHLNDIVLGAAIVSRSTSKISCSSRVYPLDQPGHDAPYSVTPFTRKWLFKLFTKAVMWRADALTCVSEDMIEAYHSLFPGSRHRPVYNIIVDEPSLVRSKEPVEHEWFRSRNIPVIISAGTLTERKGFPDLVRAVKALHNRGRCVRLVILGEGPMREEIESLVKELGLEEYTWLAGRIENPLRYFARSDVFVLSSYSEGLPNVLVEAMMCGCVPVATDCPTGPREVLRNRRYGYLVPMRDPEAMARGIESALDAPISASLLNEAVAPFAPSAVIKRHFELLGLTG